MSGDPGQARPIEEAQLPRRHFTFLYASMLAVGMVVGAGIFKSPALVADAAGTTFWFFAAWIGGGLVTAIGALCYAELATAFPHAGGDYQFLRLAYGRWWAFLFAWARFAVINSGSIALLGFVLGDYLNVLAPLGPAGPGLYAALTVVALTAFNLRGVGKGLDRADYGLTGLEVVGLLIMVIAALTLIARGTPAVETSALASIEPAPPSLGYALVYALLAFGGWSEIATLSAEVRDPRRGMPRALLLSVALITALYLAVSWSLWYGLGLAGLAASPAPAIDLMAKAFGSWAGPITAIAIAFAVITSINATIVVGARTTYACARDWPGLQAIGQWDAHRQIPARAIWTQGVVALALVVFGAFYDGFQTIVDYTAPIYWLFLASSGVAVIVLRVRYPQTPRPFRTPLFPLLPLAFTASSLLMLYSALSYVTAETGTGASVGIGVLGAGCFALILVSRFAKQS